VVQIEFGIKTMKSKVAHVKKVDSDWTSKNLTEVHAIKCEIFRDIFGNTGYIINYLRKYCLIV